MRVTVATGARSEWGVLEPLVEGIFKDREFSLDLIVTGSLLSPEFGIPYSLDSHRVRKLDVEMLLSSDSSSGVAKSFGLGVVSCTEALQVLHPDLLIIEGDRYEMCALAICAYIMQVPIAHISCGDITAGSLDDGYRDCITRLSTLQFVETKQALGRVGQILGIYGDDAPRFAYHVGCLSLDQATQKEIDYHKRRVEQGTGPGSYDFLLAVHPSVDHTEILGWLCYVLEKTKSRVLLIRPNADAGGREINRYLAAAKQKNNDRSKGIENKNWWFIDNLYNDSRSCFLQKIRLSGCVIGNSSAGIVEAPALGTPTINIGRRQEGRPQASSIINADPAAESIRAAITKLQSEEFQAQLAAGIKLAYTGGNVVEKIIDHIKQWQSERRPNDAYYLGH